jgi:hypothetical protein
MSKRATGLGYGKKYDFSAASSRSPGPSQYNKPSFFELGRKKNHGKTFGVSREVF